MSEAMETEDAGTTEQEELEDKPGQCYCGRERGNGVDVQCARCMRWFHTNCLTIHLGDILPYMTNYHFLCKICNPSGYESYTKKQPSLSQMCHAAVANMTYQASHREQPQRLFSKDRDIIPFLERNWETLTPMARKTKSTWHSTIAKMMMKERDIFVCVEEHPGDPHFGLRNSDLSTIKPNYDQYKNDLSKILAAASGVETAPRGGRTSKRKADAAVAQGNRMKRGEQVAPHGYPVDHPYNKEPYRWILAEPDPHAPNRQAWDDSNEWAGKPIPGFFYRVHLQQAVLLALHDRAPQLTISGDRLSVTGEKGYSMVRATHGVNRGTWYYELTLSHQPEGSHTRLGWSQHLGNLQAPCGYDKFSYSWRSRKGTVFHESRGKHFGDPYEEGDVLGFLIHLPEPEDRSQLLPTTCKDKPLVKFKSHLYFEEKEHPADAEKLLQKQPGSWMAFYKNGKKIGEGFRDCYQGTYYPAISLYKAATVTANFGPDFKHPPKDIDFRPMAAAASQSLAEHCLADMLYFVENEGKLPDF